MSDETMDLEDFPEAENVPAYEDAGTSSTELRSVVKKARSKMNTANKPDATLAVAGKILNCLDKKGDLAMMIRKPNPDSRDPNFERLQVEFNRDPYMFISADDAKVLQQSLKLLISHNARIRIGAAQEPK